MVELVNLVKSYNALADKKGLRARVVVKDTAIYMGSVEQISYGTHQCKLCEGVEKSKEVIKSFIKLICFELGE